MTQPVMTILVTVKKDEYPLDITEFTARECGVLKQIGHLRGINDIPAAIQAVDLEAIVALAVIAANRAGVAVNPDELLDGKAGIVRLNIATEDADPSPSAAEAAEC